MTASSSPHPVPGGLAGSVLLHQVRLVPVGRRPPSTEPVDVLVIDGVVTAVGAGLDISGRVPRHDGEGRWAIPGLWDQHVHLGTVAMNLDRINLAGVGSVDEALAVVREHLRASPGAHGLLVGFGHRSARWPAPPMVPALDAVTGDRPTVLVSGDGHHAWLNSAALAMFGLAPRGGVVDEDEWFAVIPRLTELSAERLAGNYRLAARQAAARGVVGIVDMELADNVSQWPERVADDVDMLRVRTATYPDRLDTVIAAGLRTGQPVPGGRGLVTMGPLKIISDGSLNTRTAHCREPYADAAGLAEPCGKQNTTADELTALLRTAHAAGLTAAVHAIGDAAIAIALDAFEQAGASGSIEHAQLATPPDVAKLAALGVTASVQPAHLLDDWPVIEQCWPDRAAWCFPLRAMLDAGARLAMGSDAPVAPLDPWLAMAAAVHRGDGAEPWHPEQRITAAEALAASTDGQGTIAPGSRGDIVLVDTDPLAEFESSAESSANLREAQVAATFVAGRPTFPADS
jgi:predicted amidohydrolase YtcJ